MSDTNKETPMTDLQKHDARYHPNGYQEGDLCRYREALARGDDADKVAAAEQDEDRQYAAMNKIIERFNALGVLMMAQPVNEEPYEKVFAEYGIKKGDNEWKPAMDIVVDAQEWFDANDDTQDMTGYRMKVLDMDTALKSLKNQPKAQPKQTVGTSAKSPAKAPAKATPVQKKGRKASNLPAKDVRMLHAFRDFLEGAARLLNGRTGNLAALQSSRRWPLLNKIAKDPQMGAELARLTKSKFEEIHDPATRLKGVYDRIVASSQNNWNQPVGMVIPISELPELDDWLDEDD